MQQKLRVQMFCIYVPFIGDKPAQIIISITIILAKQLINLKTSKLNLHAILIDVVSYILGLCGIPIYRQSLAATVLCLKNAVRSYVCLSTIWYTSERL